MGLHRVVSAAATILVAIGLALALPVSQLRTFAVDKTCCCPDPSDCHCPDHKQAPKDQDSMRACHQQQQVSISPEAPAFTAPVLVAIAPTRAALAVELPALAAPHAPPAPRAPYGPS